MAIDYRNEDFLARIRELTGDGVDVVADSLGGRISVRSFRALRHGGRLVVFGHYSTLSHGRKSRRGWFEWYASTATVALLGLLSPSRKVSAYRIQKIHDRPSGIAGTGGGPRYPEWFGEDLDALVELLREGRIHPVVAERLPFTDARRAHEMLESSAAKGKLRRCLSLEPMRETLADAARQVRLHGASRTRYLPIAEHGLIGDLHTVALVGTEGTIDWYCCPRFDSPSVFAAILDAPATTALARSTGGKLRKSILHCSSGRGRRRSCTTEADAARAAVDGPDNVLIWWQCDWVGRG